MVDITHDCVEQQVSAVMSVLAEIGATEQPIITALNKVDRLGDPGALPTAAQDLPNTIAVSALTGWGLPNLIARMEEVLGEELVEVDFCFHTSAATCWPCCTREELSARKSTS